MSTYNNTTAAINVYVQQPPLPTPGVEPQSRNKIDLRKQLASQLSGGSGKHCNMLKKQSYVSKPTKGGASGQKSQVNGSKSLVNSSSSGLSQGNGVGNINGHQFVNHQHNIGNYCVNPMIFLPVFEYLKPMDLARCALVCRGWAAMSADSSLWRKLDVTGKRLTASCLAGVVKRQPEVLLMNWTAIAKRQLEWMIAKLTRLKVLSLQGCSWSGVTALRTSNVVPSTLTSLDLSYVTGMSDSLLREVLSPPADSRSSSNDNTIRGRFRNLRSLKLAGVDIGDVSLRYVVQYVPSLVELDLSQNYRITDAGIAQLTFPASNAVSTLQVLDLSGCVSITDTAVDLLLKCIALRRLDMKQTPKVTTAAINKFLQDNNGFSVTDTRLLIKNPSAIANTQ